MKIMMNLTNNINLIISNFGKFPTNAHYNDFGIFYSPIKHKVCLYMGTNCGIYYAIQCEEINCQGFGHKSKLCPHLINMNLCHNGVRDGICELINNNFKYRMIYNYDGTCSYFTDDGKKTI